MTRTDGGDRTPAGAPAAAGGNLDASLRQLAALVTSRLALPELLEQVAGFAARAVPGVDGAGLVLLSLDGEPNQATELAASAPFVRDIDALQCEVLGEGPARTATQERRTVRSGSLGGDERWPRFGPRVSRLGLHSVLCLPLLLPGQPVGAISLYARAKDAFDERATRLGESFAAPAAVAVHNAQVLAQARELTGQLQAALASRPIIDQAVGILRARTGASADEAFGRLRAISQAENTKLAAVAQRIVDEAVRRARARHGES